MSQEHTLDISWKTIAKVFVAIFIFYFIYLARDIALWFFFGLAISILLEPAINFLRRIWIPKMLAIILIYVSVLGLLGLMVYLTAPIFIIELKEFSNYLPDYFNKINPILQQLGIDFAQSFSEFTGSLVGGLEQSSKGIMNAIMAFFGGLASTLVIMTIAFFLSIEDRGPERFLAFISPQKYQEHIVSFFEKAQTKVAGWFGARIIACIFVGIGSFIVFYIFGVEYAFLLALISGILNFVPYIGPLITAVLLLIFVMVSSGSWLITLYVLLAIWAVQAIENNLLTPFLMKKMIDLPPVLVLISLLLGAKIFGFLGAIFIVPVAGIVYEFVRELLEKRREGVMGSED
ncbi:MAG: AI-2E family transporter [Candidatus Staskawiczbacteria bacterium]|nr:AI-2E family transporter [Candidatus Staskawiczbacteria bacterium]